MSSTSELTPDSRTSPVRTKHRGFAHVVYWLATRLALFFMMSVLVSGLLLAGMNYDQTHRAAERAAAMGQRAGGPVYKVWVAPNSALSLGAWSIGLLAAVSGVLLIPLSILNLITTLAASWRQRKVDDARSHRRPLIAFLVLGLSLAALAGLAWLALQFAGWLVS